ncbi:MAG: hypothetical protein M0R17_02530 [Candidatus Omnitrophica bacterium]|jgi:hypothetical protein|nr:hypothetical protein [Candidatus Omnitrophota bacterium]
MRNYFYKLNKTYIENFSKKVITSFRNNDIHSYVSFLKTLFIEINYLFKFIGGMLSSKDKLQKRLGYPETNTYNEVLNNLDVDIKKLYSAQTIINSDVNNLLSFNSTQRIKTYENLTSTQQQVYSLYIKNRKVTGNEIIIPVENPFTSSDNMSSDSKDVCINQDRGSLTLKYESSIEKSIDLDNVFIYFSDSVPKDNIYPNNKSLHLGSHWKTSSNDQHYISDNLTDIKNYKTRLIDDVNSNYGVGWCEFEAVRTEINSLSLAIQNLSFKKSSYINNIFTSISKNYKNPDEITIKNYIGKKYNRDAESIYFDINNSLQGTFISYNFSVDNYINPKYKLVIPFLNNVSTTNEIRLDFEPDKLGFFPKIVWDESKVYSNDNGIEIAYSLISPSDYNNVTYNGEYRLIIKDGYIKPSRVEVILEYGSDSLHWVPINFYMSHYSYNSSKNYNLTQPSGDEINLILNKTYDIFVDSENDDIKEKNRALNVLLGRKK